MVVAVSACAPASTLAPQSSSWERAAGFGPAAPLSWSGQQDDPSFERWDQSRRQRQASSARPAAIFDVAYRLYSRYLTQVDGPRCEHRPTCSRYAHEALQKHGFVLGSMLTIDRLMRANRSSVLRQLPIDKVEDGQIYYRDPVEHNDFFL
ncbi:MAG: membrane protein insertion efficiency factor YidD [Bradymonadaceae bacterium]|nr:membrane protein insertion efficiency factor YidD [Lujinxingiaceae bacterium]